MQLDIISDTVCPWCYIGKKRLDTALAEFAPGDITINWRPFQLDPSIPQGGMDRSLYIERKFGNTASVKAAGEAIREAGLALGIDFQFERTQRMPNTLDSHRLIRWAGTAGCQNEVVDILFRRYFTGGEDIGSHEVLSAAATEAGMDADIIRDLLAKDTDIELIRQEDAIAHQMGIQGVPSFVIEKKWVIVGAQDSGVLNRTFRQLIEQSTQLGAAE